jgi:ArsR family transcriptional regulator, arsenate/arsenite/antimonite-responsive transcriptional repressor
VKLAAIRHDIKFFRYDASVTALSVIQCCAPLNGSPLTEDEATELERVFKALADRHRVKILNRLLAADGEAVCVCDFQDLLDLKQSSVSYHLKQLLDAGIVTREKRGSFAYFAIADGALERVSDLLRTPAAA